MTSQSRIPLPTPPPAPYRNTFGEPRPATLAHVPLPPAAMPARQGLRPLKAWRYVGIFGPELMVCAAVARIGPARQSFWAVWDRRLGELHERTSVGTGTVELKPGRLRIEDRAISLHVALEETAGIEAICPAGRSYAWTRKQGGVRARGVVAIRGQERPLEAPGVIDDTAGYYQRHTHWRWSAGVGRTRDGRKLAWNLVDGVNDPPASSERTVWVDGAAYEPPPSRFAPDLEAVDGLRFHPEATRQRSENLLIVRSRYRQPFGTFEGELPRGIVLAEGYGVMEEHEVWW